MIVYSFLILICVFLQFFCKKNRRLFFNLTVIMLFLVSAFRYNVGTDYEHYGNIFQWILNGYDVYVESGFKILNIFVQKVLNMDVIAVYFISSLIIIISFAKSIKDNVDPKYWFISIFIFICSGIYFASFNLIRQYIAIAIIVAGIPLLIKKRYIKYSILVLIASTFHTSALIVEVFILFLMLFRNRNNTNILWCLYIVSILFMVIDIRNIFNLFSMIIPDRWLWYLNSDFLLKKNTSAILKQIVPNITIIFLLRKRKYILKNNVNADVYILGYFMFVIITNCFFGVLLLLRLSNYFDFYLIYCVPLIIEFWRYNENKKITMWLFILYYLVLTIVTIFIMNGHGVMPYKTIWF